MMRAVEIFAAEEGVAVRGFDLEHAVADFQKRKRRTCRRQDRKTAMVPAFFFSRP